MAELINADRRGIVRWTWSLCVTLGIGRDMATRQRAIAATEARENVVLAARGERTSGSHPRGPTMLCSSSGAKDACVHAEEEEPRVMCQVS